MESAVVMPPKINCHSSPNEHEALVPVNKALALAAIFRIAVLAGCSSPSPGGASVSGQPAPASISGSMDDWLAAVCLQGTFSNGKKSFQNASGGGFCGAKDRSGPILIGQWNDNYLMRNDISIFRGAYYASCINGQTITDFVAVGGGSQPPHTAIIRRHTIHAAA
jgi:hypothetical protein